MDITAQYVPRRPPRGRKRGIPSGAMTPGRWRVLWGVARFIADNQTYPSVRDVAGVLGHKYTNHVHTALVWLERQALLERHHPYGFSLTSAGETALAGKPKAVSSRRRK